ncbi:hypothetical protein QQ008_02435 [Fulvivirgaceae bacterium BMA10]|uniref:SGNH/GDSL hydrolase family protein n=1 Tax=Splendidivirga corallicola TaxID=3051826 RepID=A0ABT8KHJ5_9BACT|nr:hypothetical protein [Fulvivirgaceae bacterium BMA10]
MEAKSFLFKLATICTSLAAMIVVINYSIDIYGLFGSTSERQLRVHVNERTSKYLLSYNYIPENFEGIIVGPSLSANLNTKFIEDYKIYNASIMGANISELRFLINNIVENGNIRFVIVCLDPYLTKDHGKKSARIDPREYYGALGSTNLLKTYLIRFVRENKLFSSKFPNDIHNDYGFNNFNLTMPNDPKTMILQKVRERSPESTYIDPVAEKELDETLQYLRKKGIKIFAYFSPIPYQILQINRDNYAQYQTRMENLFEERDILLDLNDEKYQAYTADFNTYIDHGHLSEQGQTFVLEELKNALLKYVTPQNGDLSGR